MSTPENIKVEDDISQYFTLEVLRKKYPSNLGITNTFRAFINQKKIRASKMFKIKRMINVLEGEVTGNIAGYRPDKIIKVIEDYLLGGSYRVGPERRINLEAILKELKEFKCQLEKK